MLCGYSPASGITFFDQYNVLTKIFIEKPMESFILSTTLLIISISVFTSEGQEIINLHTGIFLNITFPPVCSLRKVSDEL